MNKIKSRMKSSFKIPSNHSEWKDKENTIMRTDIKKNIEIIKREFDGCIFMKATLHGIKIGSIALTRNDGKNIKLADIIINEGYRGFGVGSVLLTKAIESASSLGVRKIYGVMCGDTERLIKFYKSFGFEIHGNSIELYL
ncbi:GNAT family N-acetyltransferase [Escherichia coli]|uniref:GNAT family N-acetyltransferase n=1 Tax=Escherichia coli TaxID=562 RepID=UPI000B800C3F|nr:GNAT family N-acetyltransferase [Escherichia coli]